ncbi:MAG TPA: DNA/RNA nuclease SfsA, partial [Deltaproteobacteria bacterium]|nr:DNA/RNA nuclease SfsA [Deltaproteobacteria bacterium]
MIQHNDGSTIFRPFTHIMEATFIRRINRFLMECRLGGRLIRAFLPNPGRLQELLLPGVPVYIIEEDGVEGRATSHTAVGVLRDGHPVMLHTHKTNLVVRRLLEEAAIPGLENAAVVKQEVRVGHSRFDFLLNDGVGDLFLEVKSCTLFGRQVAMFPDAVTARGARHLEELAHLSADGIRAVVVFVIHWPLASVFMPDYHTDLHFARTLLAVRGSVQIIPISVEWRSDFSLSRHVRLVSVPWSYIEREARDRGSYLLIMKLSEDISLEVGMLGRVFFRKGFYIYVGSAMTNLTKRIERHRRLRKQMHWHIDYLRPHGVVRAVLPIRSADRLECSIAQSVEGISEWSIQNFGCSDCSCDSHLFA